MVMPLALPPGINPAIEGKVGEGWYDLLLELHQQLSEIDPDYQLVQVKEKFGGLRYYFNTCMNPSDPDFQVKYDKMRELVIEAEAKARETCEWCGKPGELKQTSAHSKVFKTLCDEHRKAWNEDQYFLTPQED